MAYSGSNTRHFKADKGDGLYRRSLYTFMKRTAPAPMMSNFDAPNRETCSVSRERTNTPLQALQLMNDTQYLEAARALATKSLTDYNSTEKRIAFIFQSLSSREVEKNEIKLMQRVLEQHHNHYKNNKTAAKDLLSHGEFKHDEKLNTAELAAWTMLSSQILNLDEVITKE